MVDVACVGAARGGAEHAGVPAARARHRDPAVGLLLLQTADQHPGPQLVGEEVGERTQPPHLSPCLRIEIERAMNTHTFLKGSG